MNVVVNNGPHNGVEVRYDEERDGQVWIGWGHDVTNLSNSEQVNLLRKALEVVEIKMQIREREALMKETGNMCAKWHPVSVHDIKGCGREWIVETDRGSFLMKKNPPLDVGKGPILICFEDDDSAFTQGAYVSIMRVPVSM